MSRPVIAWLETREPRPPEDLFGKVLEALGEGGGSDSDPEDLLRTLTRVARDRLDGARGRPGRVRESAFDLLVADALVTFACEAALECEAPEPALATVLEVGGP